MVSRSATNSAPVLTVRGIVSGAASPADTIKEKFCAATAGNVIASVRVPGAAAEVIVTGNERLVVLTIVQAPAVMPAPVGATEQDPPAPTGKLLPVAPTVRVCPRAPLEGEIPLMVGAPCAKITSTNDIASKSEKRDTVIIFFV